MEQRDDERDEGERERERQREKERERGSDEMLVVSVQIETIIQRTRSIGRFVKTPYPDCANPDRELPLQPLVFSTNSMR